jgi:hypothetical protein
VRSILFGIILLGILGLAAELLLLEHFEEWRQWLPLALLTGSLIAWGAQALVGSAGTVRFLQGMMGLCIVAGVVGVWFHYQGNTEFELEMYPAMAGWELFKESMMGATPALAPGAMVQLGLIGLAWSFRHPALAGRTGNDVTSST